MDPDKDQIIADVNKQLTEAGIPLEGSFADAARAYALSWIKTQEDLQDLRNARTNFQTG